MKLTRFLAPDGAIRCGIDRGDGTAELLADSPVPDPRTATGQVAEIGRRLAPVVPPNVFCIGLNYREHAEETGSPIPERPVIFMKPTTAVNDPGGRIVLPAAKLPDYPGPEVDSEAELAVVIGRHCDGKPARNVREAEALDHVLGYTCANDVSARNWQKQSGGKQWVRGKGFDTFCPLGPALVTPGNSSAGNDGDHVIDYPQNLTITGTVNGQVMQSSNTRDMIFSVAELIAFLSQDTTLLPGTVILTGTPPGVGFVRTPPVCLSAGGEVVVEIEGIGVLRNPVVGA